MRDDPEDDGRVYLPTPEEIERECAKLRPGKLKGNDSPTRSTPRILERIIEYRPDPRDDKEDAA